MGFYFSQALFHVHTFKICNQCINYEFCIKLWMYNEYKRVFSQDDSMYVVSTNRLQV